MTAGAGRSRFGQGLLAGLALAGVAGFTALGLWQLERRAWKLELIDRVERRVHADPASVPGPDAWSSVDAARDAYRRVRLSGRFLHDSETLVQAVTDLGGGYWVLTPLMTSEGTTVLVNRGFVPIERRDPATRPAGNPGGESQVTGLLRITEPEGGFLRRNDPAAGRWYSRDIAAIAAARGLADVAPFFIDADASSDMPGGPRGGLTVVAFSNHHLVYALTWFGLAIMAGVAVVLVVLPPKRWE